jgi:hypothetical protein
MAELRAELKRSLGLIGQLDTKANELVKNLGPLLESIQTDGYDSESARAVSEALESISYLRSNSAAEAHYIEDTVKYIQEQIELEIAKLRDPAFKYAIAIDKPKKGASKKKVVLTFNAPSDEPRYCLCDDISYGEMIACDNPKCKIEWYHLPCVGLTHAPKSGKWYCPACRKKKKSR